jgi:hypothetical protein
VILLKKYHIHERPQRGLEEVKKTEICPLPELELRPWLEMLIILELKQLQAI